MRFEAERRRSRGGSMLSALMVFCLTAQAAGDDAQVEKLEKIQILTQQGIELFKKKEYEKALGVFQEAGAFDSGGT